jgi:hypothetical protein
MKQLLVDIVTLTTIPSPLRRLPWLRDTRSHIILKSSEEQYAELAPMVLTGYVDCETEIVHNKQMPSDFGRFYEK